MMRKAAFGAIAGARRRAADPAIYTTWVSRVDAASGTYAVNSKSICLNLANALIAESYYSKLVWLLPLLGSNLAAARVPLVDTINVGIAGNTNFVDADFTQTYGLQGNGTSKRLDSLIKPSQLGSSNNGGIGYWENNISFAGTSVEPMGCYATSTGNGERYVIDLRNTRQASCWGSAANTYILVATAAVNAHYYTQRASSTSRELFRNGSSIGTTTLSDAAAGANSQNIKVIGCTEAAGFSPVEVYWAGRCAVAYMTDGTLGSGDVSALHTLLSTYLITPTGR